MLGLVAAACSGRTQGNQPDAGGTSSGASSVGGKTPGNSKSGTDAGGSVSVGGSVSAGGSPDGGAAAAGTGTVGDGGMETSGSSNGGASGSAGVPDPNDILKVKPSAGCGKAATQATGEFVKFTIQTSGTKDNDCADKLENSTPKCGDWSVPRDYYVWLPSDYEKTHAYPLVLQGPGCGGVGTNVYPLSPDNTDVGVGVGVNGTVIRVGLTPPPSSIGHGTNPNQGCFDDKEGDDSVDFVFYETLIDKLKTELCYDENRVFVSGNSSGAWIANELGCKYAGNTEGYAIRGVAVSTGGLPNQPQWSPTCTQKPMAGMWIWEVGDLGDAFSSDKFAVARAMKVNGCTTTDYDAAFYQHMVEDFPIGGGNLDTTCKRILGCAPQFPVVVCALPGAPQGSHNEVANPGFATFISGLKAK